MITRLWLLATVQAQTTNKISALDMYRDREIMCLFVYLFIYLRMYVCLCLFIYLFTYLFMYFVIYFYFILFIYLFIYCFIKASGNQASPCSQHLACFGISFMKAA